MVFHVIVVPLLVSLAFGSQTACSAPRSNLDQCDEAGSSLLQRKLNRTKSLITSDIATRSQKQSEIFQTKIAAQDDKVGMLDEESLPTPAMGKQNRRYIPGERGAPWTQEEVLIVKAKLRRILGRYEGGRILEEVFGKKHNYVVWRDAPSAPKMLRLGFHDCLKYTDGSGGCDGCLHWDGVGDRFRGDQLAKFELPVAANTNNNGLAPTVVVLEEIYTNPQFPAQAPALEESLQASGKSRADLWAFAAIAATEFGIENNNRICDNPHDPYSEPQCHHDAGNPSCRIATPRHISFMTGRRDCKTKSKLSYITDKTEVHPNPSANGKETVKFMKAQFGFTGQETVAIMGAHTFGRFHVTHSMFRYTWTTRSTRLFNNLYYRNLVGKREWFFNDDACTKVGDAYGKKGKARWLPHVRGDNVIGGPVQWLQEKLVCENCKHPTNKKTDCCSKGVPEGGLCRPDNGRGPETDAALADNDVDRACEAYRFISGLDEAALNSDMGLYRDFNTSLGVPTGCHGMEDFNPKRWRENIWRYWWTMIDGKKAEPQCQKNMLKEPSDAPKAVSEVFEEYANNQQKWISDYIPAMEKMIANGYGDLEDGPDYATNIHCPWENPVSWNRFFSCWDTTKLSTTPFYIVSNMTQQVLQMNDKTRELEVWMRQGTTQQLWRWTADGSQLINEKFGIALVAGIYGQWAFKDGMLYAKASIGQDERILDRTWNKKDGAKPGLWQPYDGINQQWHIAI